MVKLFMRYGTKMNDEKPRRRGRPQIHDPRAALRRATDTFWKTGYSGTSLDALSAATGMSRPSLYAAFGDKHALYLEALARYWELALASVREALSEDLPLDEALMRAYDGALSIYLSGGGRPRGCFAVGTAVTEAYEDDQIRHSIAAGFQAFDSAFEVRFQMARDRGELDPDADPSALATLATATMHTIAVRVRAGYSRADLRELARKSVRMMCR